jgi:hypothetical protein
VGVGVWDDDETVLGDRPASAGYGSVKGPLLEGSADLWSRHIGREAILAHSTAIWYTALVAAKTAKLVWKRTIVPCTRAPLRRKPGVDWSDKGSFALESTWHWGGGGGGGDWV